MIRYFGGSDIVKKDDIENIVNETLNAQELVQINKNLYLTNYQRQVLEQYHIPYQSCQSGRELLFLLSDIVDDEEYDELEEVARQIDEFAYYHETDK